MSGVMDTNEPNAEKVIAETRAWVSEAVIGLNLCPFARAVQVRDQIRYVVTEVSDLEALLGVLREELRFLAAADPEKVETTLLIHPWALEDFGEFNAFHDDAEAAVEELDLTGVLQVASFHPRYQFAGTEPGDVTNATNQSPYPTLHLLREESIERAVESVPDPAAVYEANIRTLQELGAEGWEELRKRWCPGASGKGDSAGG